MSLCRRADSTANPHPLLPQLDARQPSQPWIILGCQKQWLHPLGWERDTGECSKERGSERWAQAAARVKLLREGSFTPVSILMAIQRAFQLCCSKRHNFYWFSSSRINSSYASGDKNTSKFPAYTLLPQPSVKVPVTAASVIPLWPNSNVGIH